MYDSTIDTKEHINSVQRKLNYVAKDIVKRGLMHDASKLQSPEKEVFDEFTPKLKDTTYGSKEYKQFLKEMKVALDHHYKSNPHHPEHFENGINDMTLVDVIEMIFDWLAASERHEDGDIFASIEENVKRFKISDQLKDILVNTVNWYLRNKNEKNISEIVSLL